MSGAPPEAATTRIAWTIVTGEYPPVPGGVSDYTAQVARALVRAGDRVRVWTSGDARAPEQGEDGVTVLRRPDAFGRQGLRRATSIVAADPGPRRLLVQYVPHSFGWRAMNLPFARWVGAFRAAPVDVMFHEVAFPWSRRPRHALLAAVTRLMAREAARGADRVFVSTASWDPLLRRLGLEAPAQVTPVPSNVPALAVREPQHDPGAPRFGHFGTFGAAITPLLQPAIVALLERVPGARAVLVGRGSREFAARLAALHPELGERLEASGEVTLAAAAERLTRCDVLVQPFPDGANTRRSSLIAGLALGLPVVTNRGVHTEALWDRAGAVVLADDPASVADEAAALLADPGRRAALAAAARRAHDEHFSVDRTIERLRALDSRPFRSGRTLG